MHIAEMAQERFEEHNHEFKVLTLPPDFTDPICEHLWDVLDQQAWTMEVPSHSLLDLQDLLPDKNHKGIPELCILMIIMCLV